MLCIHVRTSYNQWLEKVFLSYLDDWEKNVNERAGYTDEKNPENALEPANNAGTTDGW